MADWQDMLAGHRAADLSDDFEQRVWRKIGRRKKRRTIVAGTAVAVAVATVAVVLIPLLGLPSRGQRDTLSARLPQTVKQEIPVSDNLYFATQDGRTVYTIERVAFQNAAADSEADNGSQNHGI